ncbi:transposase, partial [Mycolicibacterium mucogenicum]
RNGGRLKNTNPQVLTITPAEDALEHLNEQWGARYLALIRMWRSCWNEFIPFLDYPTEIRRVLRSTNAI